MTRRKGDILELRIDKVAYGGQGVARLDGLVLFVRGAIPGDRVRAQVVKKKRDYAEARLTELLEPSLDRVEAPCPYHGFCGGCQWQHARYERQLEYKKEHIKEATARIGSLPDVQVHNVIPSEKQFAYRNKMEFSFSDHRWLLPHEYEDRQGEAPRAKASERDFALGLHVPGTFYKVIDIEACLLQHETGNRILREVKKYVRKCGIPGYGLKSHQGFWRFLTLRHSTHFNKWMVNLVTSEERSDVVQPLAEALCHEFHNIHTVVNNINTRRAAIAVGERERVLSGNGTLQDRIGPFHFHISANSFFQTNSLCAEKLYQKVVEYAEVKGAEWVLDLYSGTGTIPIFLSNKARAVIGMEIAESAILDAQRNCQANDIQNCHFLFGDIRERLSALKLKPDVLIIDPPRAGMHRDILSKVMELGTGRIIYVSCNPATMARDLGTMRQDYHIVEIQPVDMFPHTYHIEAVAKLIRR
jgi:23S rRNA (uracil1939-C5)-methyltransferase